MKGGAIRRKQKRKDEGINKAYKEGARNHATWRMDHSKITGEDLPLEMHKHSR